MLNPAIGKLINSCESRYKLVLDVAHRARKIAQEAEERKEILTEKTVTLAMNEMAEELDKQEH